VSNERQVERRRLVGTNSLVVFTVNKSRLTLDTRGIRPFRVRSTRVLATVATYLFHPSLRRQLRLDLLVLDGTKDDKGRLESLGSVGRLLVLGGVDRLHGRNRGSHSVGHD
jgi:hypothetical protein